jgi:hypothetical protein
MESKNIFEVNGIKYSSNIPPQTKICLNQEEYDEYLQLKNDSIPKQVIRDKIKELIKYRDLAKELIEHKIVVADSDSLNYGRSEAHDKDIQVLKELLGE